MGGGQVSENSSERRSRRRSLPGEGSGSGFSPEVGRSPTKGSRGEKLALGCGAGGHGTWKSDRRQPARYALLLPARSARYLSSHLGVRGREGFASPHSHQAASRGPPLPAATPAQRVCQLRLDVRSPRREKRVRQAPLSLVSAFPGGPWPPDGTSTGADGDGDGDGRRAWHSMADEHALGSHYCDGRCYFGVWACPLLLVCLPACPACLEVLPVCALFLLRRGSHLALHLHQLLLTRCPLDPLGLLACCWPLSAGCEICCLPGSTALPPHLRASRLPQSLGLRARDEDARLHQSHCSPPVLNRRRWAPAPVPHLHSLFIVPPLHFPSGPNPFFTLP